MRVLGLMSGTSLDGVDACLAEIHGAGERLRWRVLHASTSPFPAGLRGAIERQLDPAGSSVDELAALDVRLGEAFADAALAAIAAAGLTPAELDLIGSHGQTLWHAPTGAWPATLQLGRGAVIAVRTGVTTVSDFRPADVALGGQGAPLVPYADKLLFGAGGRRVAIQNLGGIGNVTLLPEGLAFDTGPGNMLIDAAVARVTGGELGFDEGGRLAAAGRVDERLVARWLAEDDYMRLPPPKSTGRERYGAQRAAALFAAGPTGADLVATVTAYTAATVADAYRRFLPEVPEVLVCGGGALNPTLLDQLRARLGVPVRTTAEAGVDPAFKEALAFALLAYQAVHGRANVLPAATGAREPWVLGSITPGRNFARVVLAAPPAAADAPATEQPNPDSVGLDMLTAAEAVDVMHEQDWQAVRAVGAARPAIAALVEAAAAALAAGGRLFYVGAGTSGRLGVLDASECPPTFSAPPELVQALIAGGERALREAVEGAEDDAAAGASDLAGRGVRAGDVVVGISANGGAPYVRGALEAARAAGAATALVTCNPPRPGMPAADHVVLLPTGPELVAGSTRLKAGTATKLALNMVSTLSMVALGKVHDNLMVDVKVSNRKLRARAERLVSQLTGLAPEAAGQLLDRAGGRVKLAAVMHHQDVDAARAEALLAAHAGRLRSLLRG